MRSHPRPAWRNRAVPLIASVAAVLTLAMCTVGVEGPAARVIPVIVGGSAAATAFWAVRRWRSDRAEYERRLTAWAAAEAVLEERLHIARDLHDLVSHGLGLITVRAAATRHLEQSGPIREALGDIEETSREATAELRRMLTVLREPDAVPRAPADSLAVLPEIVRAAGTAGLRPSLTSGDLGEVSPGVQVAICRTVREGLANVARHAGPVDVAVRVHRDGRHVVVTVADDGPAPGWRPVPGAGHGLAGLRERVGSLDGGLVAEPVDGGFRLTARVPDGVRTR
ncbi:MAG TPA: histidine kinase [Actinoplanes sp.]|nr:histidine kinase [Actinoplanes sp.]